MVSVDHGAKGFARIERPRALNYRERARVVLRRFDEQKMIGHLDHYAVMRLPREEPHARRRLTHRNRHSRSCRRCRLRRA